MSISVIRGDFNDFNKILGDAEKDVVYGFIPEGYTWDSLDRIEWAFRNKWVNIVYTDVIVHHDGAPDTIIYNPSYSLSSLGNKPVNAPIFVRNAHESLRFVEDLKHLYIYRFLCAATKYHCLTHIAHPIFHYQSTNEVLEEIQDDLVCLQKSE